MAGRRGPHVLELHDHHPPLLGHPPRSSDDPLLLRRLPRPRAAPPAAVAVLEDRLASMDREINALLLDNQRLAAVHVALRQELLSTQQELQLAVDSASRVRAAKEAELQAAIDRSRHADVAVHHTEGVRAELARMTENVRRLVAARDEFLERLGAMRGELSRARAEAGRGAVVKEEIETMHRELQKGRAAVEFEKKAHAENQEQSKAMESNMASMAHEIEKLRAELANMEKRAAASATSASPATNPRFVGSYTSSEVAYGSGSYADVYSMHQVQVQRAADGNPQYGSASVSHTVTQQPPHVHR